MKLYEDINAGISASYASPKGELIAIYKKTIASYMMVAPGVIKQAVKKLEATDDALANPIASKELFRIKTDMGGSRALFAFIAGLSSYISNKKASPIYRAGMAATSAALGSAVSGILQGRKPIIRSARRIVSMS